MLNVLFAGTPECAVPALEAAARAHRIVAVLTNPPASSGRSGTLVSSPVAQAAERLKALGLIDADAPILTPAKITEEVRAAIAERKPDIMACFAYGKIFGPKTLALFPRGAVNIHPSLLPRWRGSSPVPAAILARDAETGITIQRMALEMDAGDILVQTHIPLDGTETAESLLARAAAESAPLLAATLDRFAAGDVVGTPQDGTQATFCKQMSKEDGRIDWTASAADIDARIRAYTPWPLSFTQLGERTLLVLKARPFPDAARASGSPDAEPGKVVGIDKKAGILVQTGDGLLALETLQWQSKKPLDWKSFLNGSRDFVGSVLGAPERPQ